jgi:hypothetical protein
MFGFFSKVDLSDQCPQYLLHKGKLIEKSFDRTQFFWGYLTEIFYRYKTKVYLERIFSCIAPGGDVESWVNKLNLRFNHFSTK